MTRNLAVPFLVTGLLLVGCGGSGRHYWLYPAPRLTPAEEAVFVAFESHRVVAIDSEEAGSLCWGRTVDEPQGYRRNDLDCHLHLRPGPHVVVFEGRYLMRERNRIEFTALPGRSYRLDWSECTSPSGLSQQTCRVRVVELETSAGAPR